MNGTLNAKGGTFTGNVKFNGSSIANISGGSFNNEKKYGGVEFDYNVTGTISGGTFVFADFYTTKVKLSGGTFTMIKTNGDRKLADLLAEGAAYYNDDSAVSNDKVSSLTNVTVKSHEHNGGTDGNGTCSICGKQMAASLTAGGKTSWYTAFASAIEAANAADGEKTITLYQNVDDTVYGKRTTYELTRGPVTLATGGKTVKGVDLIAKGISLTVTGSNGSFYVTVDGKDAELTVNDKDTKLAIVTAKNGGKLSLSNGTFSRVDVMNDGSSASLSGGSYGEITSGTNYVKPYELLAKGYAYKRTRDNKWLPNANSISEKVTVEKAPFAVEKIYPNSDTNYTGNSAFATDGNITLTAVIASEPETENVTYYYWWEVFDELENDWTSKFYIVNNATHDGKQSKTLTISELPVGKSYQYHVFVQCSNGYQCYSEPFTVTRHQHSWTYTASGATITAKCTAEGCYLTDGNGGSVTIAAPAELTYSGEGKPATVTASSDWQGPAASGITISYIKSGKYIQQLENGALPTNAGTYTASITLGEATASVKYTIQKANPVVTEWPKLSAPVYVNSEATLTGGSGEGTFAFKAGAAKSWDSAGSKTTTIVFTPTYTNNYNELTQDYIVTVVKRTVKNCNMLTGITDKPCGTAQEELGLPGTVTITTVDGKTFNDIPVTWSGYNPNTLKEQTLTGTLDLTSIAGEVEQPSTPVTAQIKVKLTQKHFSGISPEAYEGEYDGNAHGITLTGVPSGATVKYGTSVNSCTQDSLTYTDFTNGPKFVYYKVSQSGYADASGSAWVNITKRPLTVTGITANDKAYDGNTNVVLDYSAVTLGGVLKNDALTVTATGRLESAGVGEQKVTISDLTLSGDSAANYVLAESGNQSETTANITARKVAVTITPNGGTYGSVVAAAAKLTGAVDGENVPVTLTYTSNGYNDTAVPVNAGSYKVTASIADSNYTLTGNTTADFVITPKAVTVSGITAKDKVYDGTTNADISSVTFDNVTLNRGTDYTVTASFDKASVGKSKNITATVTLIGPAAKNYALEQSSFTTTGSITKAAVPGSGLRPAVTVINDLAKTYEMVLSNDYLPKLSSPCEYGNVSYSLRGTYLTDGYKNMVQAEVVEENGQYKLKLTVPAVDYNKVSSVGTLRLNVSSDNYQDFPLDIGVKAKNKDVPVPDGPISASDITYGQALNDSKIAGKMKAGGKAIDGTFTWTNGTFKPAAGDYPASWTFTPAKGFEEYATATGTATVTVDPKAVTVSGITANGKVYDGTTNAVLDYSNAQFDGILENDKLTVAAKGVFEKAEAGKQNVAISDLTLVGNSANNYVLAESGNQTRTTATIDPKSIDGATVKLGKGLTANGAEQTQTVEKVLLDGKELPADSYTVTGNTATAHGIYTLTVTGKGNYKDFVKWTYVIAPAKAEDAPGEDITIGSGKVKVDVKSEGTVPPATLLTDKAELIAMLVNSGDITADELVQIANGASVDIVLTVKEANVSDEVKTAMAQDAKGYTIGQYLDISLFKYMTVNGSQQAGVPLHTTKDALTISVVVPDALIHTDSAVNRNYCIVRNHEGTITVLDAAFDAAGKTLTFKTDRFSIYAIAYKDTAVPSSGSNPGSNNSSNDSETKKNEVAAPTPAPTPASTSKPSTITAMPQTGDTSNPTLYVVLLVASLLGLAVVFVCKKRNDK